MTNNLKSQLKALKHSQVNPSSDWLNSNRALLLSQIKNTVSADRPTEKFNLNNIWSLLSVFVPQTLVFNFVRPIAVLLIVALVGTSGWVATVDASYESLPGEWLYPAKRAVEKTQVTIASVTGDKNSEAKLHAEFAKRRATEVKKIMTAEKPASAKVVQDTVQDLKTEIQNVNSKLNAIKSDAVAGNAQNVSADTVKEVKTTTDEVKVVLGLIKDDLQSGTGTIDNALNKSVSEVKDMANATAVNAMGVMVEQHLSGDTSVTKEEVKKELDKTLASAAADIVENKQNVEGVKTIVDAVTSEVKDLTKESQLASSTISTTTTKNLTDQMTDIASTTKAAAVKTDAAAVAGDKKIAEAKEKMSQNDLSGAMDSVKELTAVAKEAEKIKDTALQTVQTVQNVLPIANLVKDLPVVSTTAAKVEIKFNNTTPVATGTLPLKIIVVTSTKK
ncbi:MAG: DUF5667 domain-containing protein [Candidatus Magasanikbacteria bacterium]